ncbi:hypothetical protein EDD17DRAFT_522601 [Pisolithus thermaeus]|nr:hypothetical protein EDD17DRAFT_522601 [Pisolithus thermaeus]
MVVLLAIMIAKLVLRKALGLLRAGTGLSALLARDRLGKRHVDGSCGIGDARRSKFEAWRVSLRIVQAFYLSW